MAVCEAIEAPNNRFDSPMVELMGAHQVPGAAVAVVRGGEAVLVRAYGCADVASGRPVDLFSPPGSHSAFLAVIVRAAETGGGEIVYGMPTSMALFGWVPPQPWPRCCHFSSC